MSTDPAPGRDHPDWRRLHDDLSTRPTDQLGPAELDDLAASLIWLNEPWRSVEVRRLAHQRWLDAGEDERAARSAWFVFYEHWLVGEASVARGWLARARRLVTEPESVAAGWVALAEADVAGASDRLDEAVEAARSACRIGRSAPDPDLVAMGLQAEGRALVAGGHTERGLACLDEAMVAVIGNELEPLYTGWIYCNVISTCHAVGDLRRANEWSEAALRWCAELRDGRLYPGLCRVYAAQLAQLRGDWDAAERDARRACDDLLAFDRRYAGAAHYVVGDLCRLRGRLDEAGRYYQRSHELGHDPQPGLALLHAATGRLDEALDALRPTVGPAQAAGRDGPIPASEVVLPHLERLLAVVDLADRAGDTETLTAATERAVALSRVGPATAGSAGEVVEAYALSARGQAAVALGDPAAGIGLLRRAVALLLDLGLPYEAACRRLVVARAAAALGDDLTATVEAASAHSALERLGAAPPSAAAGPVRSGRSVAGGGPTGAAPGGGPLSAREREVLVLVAEGLTNREVADRLHLSRHTVARHLANTFAKLGVRTRAAAVATAVARSIIATGPD